MILKLEKSKPWIDGRETTCKICGSKFIKIRPQHIYCSKECQVEGARRNRREWRKTHREEVRRYKRDYYSRNKEKCRKWNLDSYYRYLDERREKNRERWSMDKEFYNFKRRLERCSVKYEDCEKCPYEDCVIEYEEDSNTISES